MCTPWAPSVEPTRIPVCARYQHGTLKRARSTRARSFAESLNRKTPARSLPSSTVVSQRSFASKNHVNPCCIGAGRVAYSALRVNGVAQIAAGTAADPPYPEAQFIVKVLVRQVFPNCPRYIHKMQRIEPSKFVPRPEVRTPVPGWKRMDWACAAARG